MKIAPHTGLFFGVLATGILALSVHVFMSDVLHIPYPHNYPRTNWPVYCSNVLLVFTAIYCYQLSKNQLIHSPTLLKCLGVFILLAMLNGDLIRAPLMTGIVTSAWLFSFIQNLPRLLPHLLLACAIVLTASKLCRTWQQILMALLLGGLLPFLASIARGQIAPLLNSLQPRPEDIIHPPYGINVMLPSYLSFYESVLACLMLASLVWKKLSPRPMKRLVQFALLVLLLRGLLLAPLIYVFYAGNMSPTTAVLSVGQFFLQDLVLALLTATFWQRWHNRHQKLFDH